MSEDNVVKNPPIGDMTLRDVFAGQAMLGLVMSQTGSMDPKDSVKFLQYVPLAAYDLADRMLVARGPNGG